MPNNGGQRGDSCCGAYDLSSRRRLVHQLWEGEELWDEAVQHLWSRKHPMHSGGRDVYSSERADRETCRCVCVFNPVLSMKSL